MKDWARFEMSWLDYNLFGDEKFTSREAWTYINLYSQHPDKAINLNGYWYSLQDGAVCFGYSQLRKAWGWGNDRIQKFFTTLQESKLITIQEMYGFHVITMLDPNEKAEVGRPRNQRQTIPNSEYKKQFEILWVAYKPVHTLKGNKIQAMTSFKRARKKVSFENMMKGLKMYIKQCHETKTYTKNVATWLNQYGWDVESITASNGSGDNSQLIEMYGE